MYNRCELIACFFPKHKFNFGFSKFTQSIAKICVAVFLTKHQPFLMDFYTYNSTAHATFAKIILHDFDTTSTRLRHMGGGARTGLLHITLHIVGCEKAHASSEKRTPHQKCARGITVPTSTANTAPQLRTRHQESSHGGARVIRIEPKQVVCCVENVFF